MSFLEIVGGLSIVDALLGESEPKDSGLTETDVRRAVIRGVTSAGVHEDDISVVVAHVMVELEAL